MQESNLRLFAQIATVAAWTVFAFSLTIALLIVTWMATGSETGRFSPIMGLIGLVSLAHNLISLLSIIPMLLWIHTAHANLRAAGVTGLRHSPAWATFCFFVPVANLIVPFVAMRELANRSAGEPEEFAGSTVDDVTSWWSCFILSTLVGTAVAITLAIDALPGVLVTTPLWAVMGLVMVGQLLYAAAAFFTVKVVRLVTRSQLSGSAERNVFE